MMLWIGGALLAIVGIIVGLGVWLGLRETRQERQIREARYNALPEERREDWS